MGKRFALFLFIFVACHKSVPTDNIEFDKYMALCASKRYDNADSLKQYLLVIDSLFLSSGDEKFNWLSNNLNGQVLSKNNNYNEAIVSYNKAIEIAKKLKIDTLLARTFNDLAVCYREIGSTDKAFEILQKCMKISSDNNNLSLLTSAKINLANLYFNKGDLKQTKATLDEVAETQDARLLLLHQHSLANYYGASGFIDSALMVDNAVIEKNKDNVKELTLSPFYNNKAFCFMENKLIDSAIYYLQKSYVIDSLNGNPKNMGANLLILADIYLSKKELDNAVLINQKAIEIFNSVDSKKNLANGYRQLSKCFQSMNDWKMAHRFQDSTTTILNKVNSLAINNKIEALKIEYEIEKKDNIIENQKSSIRSQRIMLALMALLSALALALYYFITKNARNIKNYEYQQILVNSSLEAQSIERERIARDLHDSVGQKLAVVKMQMSMNAEMSKSARLLDEAIQDLRDVTHNLMPTDLSKGLSFAIQSMCDQVNFLNKIPNIEFVSNPPDADYKIDEHKALFIYRITQELLSNSIKYANASKINIQILYEKNRLMLVFKDDGIGLKSNILDQTDGIGLKNIKKRLAQLNGKVDIESAENKGILFNIEIPIN